eukprot:gene8180-9057_t
MVTTLDHHQMAIKLLRNILILCLALLVVVCEVRKSQEITTTSCGLTKACVKIPTSCGSSTDCDFLMTYKRKLTNENIMEFELSSKLATGYVALGFNQDQTMTETRGEICYLSGDSSFFQGFHVTSYFTPLFQAPAANTVLASVGLVNGAIVCRFSRPITPSGYQGVLGPSVYPIFATGVVINLTSCDVDKGCFRVPSGCKIASCKFIITWKPDVVRQEVQIEVHAAKASVWVAFGLNKVAGQMEGSRGEICYNGGSNTTVIKAFYAAVHKLPVFAEINASNITAKDLTRSQITAANGALTCRYTRKFAAISSISADIDQPTFFTIAAGSGAVDLPSYHQNNRRASTTKYDIRTPILTSSAYKMSASKKVSKMLPLTNKDQHKSDDFKPGIKFSSRIAGWFKSIFAEKASRNIFCFLLLNLSFAFLELFYGIWSNSLGLISDSFHMFFDCTALLTGLMASIISRWGKNERYSYGYVRAEVMAGFVNALFLLFVAFFIFSEAVERAFHPPHVEHERLILVSILGFIVNLIGIFVFHHGGDGHGHSHGGGSHGNKRHGHGHDPRDDQHGHGHGGSVGGHGHSHGAFTQEPPRASDSQIVKGVFLHIVADTLGSVGVIISSGLIAKFGWMAADPLCSMFISILIAVSIFPLLFDSGAVLMQRTPIEIEHQLPIAYQRVSQLDGVYSLQDPHFWTLCSKHYVGSIRLLISPAADNSSILGQTHAIFGELGVQQLYVQIEKSY